jgi:predicted nuclease of predicted toxin-antitoxin system
MKFLANMGISPVTVEFLRRLGHDATHLHEEGLDQLPDTDVLEKAHRERCVLLTNDLDFGELLAQSRAASPSVVIFRLANMRPESVNAHLAALLSRFAAELERGAIVSVTEGRIRLRKLPIASRRRRMGGTR